MGQGVVVLGPDTQGSLLRGATFEKRPIFTEGATYSDDIGNSPGQSPKTGMSLVFWTGERPPTTRAGRSRPGSCTALENRVLEPDSIEGWTLFRGF